MTLKGCQVQICVMRFALPVGENAPCASLWWNFTPKKYEKELKFMKHNKLKQYVAGCKDIGAPNIVTWYILLNVLNPYIL